MTPHHEFLERLTAADSLEPAVAAMDAYLKALTGDCFFLLGESGSIWILPHASVGTYPAEWMEIYFRRNYFFDDPMARRARQTAAPFRWSDVHPENDRERLIMKLAQDYDLVEGIVFPLVRAGYYSASFSIGGLSLEIPDELLPEIHLATLYFHNKVVSFYDDPGLNEEAISDLLTRRQIECLAWVSNGKTDWEIGEILSIQESTVHSHIEDAKKKLLAVTKAQAVVTAFKAGLIGI